MHLQPADVLQAANRPVVSSTSVRSSHVLLAGATGALGEAMVTRLASSAAVRLLSVLVREPMVMGMRRCERPAAHGRRPRALAIEAGGRWLDSDGPSPPLSWARKSDAGGAAHRFAAHRDVDAPLWRAPSGGGVAARTRATAWPGSGIPRAAPCWAPCAAPSMPTRAVAASPGRQAAGQRGRRNPGHALERQHRQARRHPQRWAHRLRQRSGLQPQQQAAGHGGRRKRGCWSGAWPRARCCSLLSADHSDEINAVAFSPDGQWLPARVRTRW